jgi:hypothetical protein
MAVEPRWVSSVPRPTADRDLATIPSVHCELGLFAGRWVVRMGSETRVSACTLASCTVRKAIGFAGTSRDTSDAASGRIAAGAARNEGVPGPNPGVGSPGSPAPRGCCTKPAFGGLCRVRAG